MFLIDSLSSPPVEDSTLVNAFSKKLYVHLGKNDTNPNSSGLRHNDVVDLQGLNRFDRGKFYFQRSSIKSESLNGTFNWEKIALDYEVKFFETIERFNSC